MYIVNLNKISFLWFTFKVLFKIISSLIVIKVLYNKMCYIIIYWFLTFSQIFEKFNLFVFYKLCINKYMKLMFFCLHNIFWFSIQWYPILASLFFGSGEPTTRNKPLIINAQSDSLIFGTTSTYLIQILLGLIWIILTKFLTIFLEDESTFLKLQAGE